MPKKTTNNTSTIPALGFTCLNPEGRHEVDIVFVHGLSGNPESTWKNSTTGFLWPKELEAHVPNARILLYGYDVHALVIANENKSMRVEDRNQIYLSTVGCFFYGTPNCGSSIGQAKRVKIVSSVLKVASFELPEKIMKALELHSDEVFDLAEGFLELDICRKETITMYTYYETRNLPELGELVVDETSARVGYGKEVMNPIQEDHIGMVKFKNAEDRDFIHVSKKVKSIVNKLREPTAVEPRAIELVRHHGDQDERYQTGANLAGNVLCLAGTRDHSRPSPKRSIFHLARR
ncbi:hypothetical protein Egran_05945 [Elaphomyces granulatus]|uniref:DUF676 domain-containing protein n=1 Tax=Elaphomyces granulatus TaxID=519963 RepID=A0A232LR68_9EURO|nr:hypothetical protein Egran_05945 [Elaphomyces granulatus]